MMRWVLLGCIILYLAVTIWWEWRDPLGGSE